MNKPFKKFKGSYWGDTEKEAIRTLLANQYNQPVIARVYYQLFDKLYYMSATLCRKYYSNFFKDRYDEVIMDSITYLFTNLWSLNNKKYNLVINKGVITKEYIEFDVNYFSYISVMFRNFYRLEVRNNKTINPNTIDNTDVYNRPKDLTLIDNLGDTYRVVDFIEVGECAPDLDAIKERILKEFHRLYVKHVVTPERGWKDPHIIKGMINHNKRKQYLAGAISYILEDFNSYSIEDMNSYIYENSTLEYDQVITQSYNFFKKQGLFMSNAKKDIPNSDLPTYKLIKEDMYE